MTPALNVYILMHVIIRHINVNLVIRQGKQDSRNLVNDIFEIVTNQRYQYLVLLQYILTNAVVFNRTL